MIRTKGRTMTVLVAVTLVAASAAAEAIPCIMPWIPRPDELTERFWDARSLVAFLQEQGVVELRGESGQTMELQAVFSLTTANGRETLAEGRGEPVKVRVGRHPMGAIDAIFDQMRNALERSVPGDPWQVLSVATLEHDERVRFPRDEQAVALTLEYVNSSNRRAPVNIHKLVLFLRAIGETEKNLGR